MATDPSASQNKKGALQQEGPAASGDGVEDSSPAATPPSDIPAGEEGHQIARPDLFATETDALLSSRSTVGMDNAHHCDGDDLLAALSSMCPNIDYALDQLTTSVDLFDVPALDFGDDLPG